MGKSKNNKYYVTYHAHSPMTFWIGMGIPKEIPMGDWYKNWWKPLIYPIESVLTKDDINTLSKLSALMYIDNKISEVWDMYFFEEEVAKSLSKYGIRVYAGEVIMKGSKTGYKAHDAVLETEKLIKKFKNNNLIKPVLGYIGPYKWASDKEMTKESAELAIKYKIPVHMHGAGSLSDFDGCKKLYGMMPIEVMEHFGFFSKEIPEVVIAHCAILHEKEINILKNYRDKIRIAVCPRASKSLNYPFATIKNLIQNDIRVVLGTDGSSPSGIPSITKEIETATKIYNINKRYFEENNKSRIETKKIEKEKRIYIINRAVDCLENIALKANLKVKEREIFLRNILNNLNQLGI